MSHQTQSVKAPRRGRRTLLRLALTGAAAAGSAVLLRQREASASPQAMTTEATFSPAAKTELNGAVAGDSVWRVRNTSATGIARNAMSALLGGASFEPVTPAAI